MHDSPLASTSTKSRRCATRAAGAMPSVLDAVDVCLAAGAPGITVHPRADRRHITPDDVREIARGAADAPPAVEFNIEGDPRPELLDLVRRGAARSVHARAGRAGRDHQPGRLAAGPGDASGCLDVVARPASRAASASACSSTPTPDADSLGGVGRRRSRRAVHRAVRARVRARRRRRRAARSRVTRTRRGSRTRSASASTPATISTSTTSCCSATLPHLDEVSIGHALISRALFVGLATVVREYLDVLAAACSSTYDRAIRSMIFSSSMKSDAIAFGIAGIAVRPDRRLDHRHPAGASRRPRRRRAARPRARRPPAAAPRAAVLDEAQVNALKAVAEREPSNAAPRVAARRTSTSTPSATTTRSSGTARRSSSRRTTSTSAPISASATTTRTSRTRRSSSSTTRSRSIRSTPRRC